MELDRNYAVLKLIEILFEKGLVTSHILQKSRELLNDSPHISQAVYVYNSRKYSQRRNVH